MSWPITSARKETSNKSLFRNSLQLMCPIETTLIVPADISCTIVDVMRIARLIPIDVNPPTFIEWVKSVSAYISALPGDTIHIIFDVH